MELELHVEHAPRCVMDGKMQPGDKIEIVYAQTDGQTSTRLG